MSAITETASSPTETLYEGISYRDITFNEKKVAAGSQPYPSTFSWNFVLKKKHVIERVRRQGREMTVDEGSTGKQGKRVS